jgi:hypothetical protein
MFKYIAYAALLVVLTYAVQAQIPDEISYQGYLTESGTPLTAVVPLTFKLYEEAIGGTEIWTETIADVDIVDGVFSVVLGPGGTPPLSDIPFVGDLWLGMTHKGAEFEPRSKLMAVPYALGLRHLRVYPMPAASEDGPNMIGGHYNNFASTGVVGATIGGGGRSSHPTEYNSVEDDYGTISGGLVNRVSGFAATVSGGYGNQATVSKAVVSGGEVNQANGVSSVVSGGYANKANGWYSTVGGGTWNISNANYAFIGGGGEGPEPDGYGNLVHDDYGTVAGGADNQAGSNDGNQQTSEYAFVGGGNGNVAMALGSTIAGGGDGSDTDGIGNVVYDEYGTIAGGGDNIAGTNDGDPASSSYAFVGGGMGNRALEQYAVVAGGFNNWASDGYSTVAGGYENLSSGFRSSVGGGSSNTASNQGATVGGGSGNDATALNATVPGGSNNTASGTSSLAAGSDAAALHDGTFVWGDNSGGHSDLFESTGSNQFLVQASGGVGVGTNQPGINIPAANIYAEGAQFDVWQSQADTRSAHFYNNAGNGLPGATVRIHNASTSAGIAASFVTEGNDATVVIDQYGSGDHLKTFADGLLMFLVTDAGEVYAHGSFHPSGVDLAEAVETVGNRSGYEPGDVLVLSTDNPGQFERSSSSYARTVAGVVATKPGVLLSPRLPGEDHADLVPMGVVGIIPTRVSGENGSIAVGDLLVTGTTDGHAMKADFSDPVRLIGAVIGKAMEPFDGSGKGLIKVLVNVK